MRNIQKILITIQLVLLVLCEEQDYYQLLGVKKNDDLQTIKKAFKKLSLKYHPDKNKNNKEQAKNQFAKIVNAYEVLKDEKKRSIYDKYGIEGNQQQQWGGGGFNGGGFNDGFPDFESFFQNNNFQGGNGHQQFHFNMGGNNFGGNNFHQEEEKVNNFEKSDVILLDFSNISRFYRRDQVWIILMFKSKKQKKSFDELKQIWKDLAQKFYGIFQVAAVDCDLEQELCDDEFNVSRTPEIQVFKSNLDSETYIYNGALEVPKIAGFAVQFMESFVSYVSDSNYNEFINRDKEKNKVILFTAKKSTPPLIKALSKDFNNKLSFGEVRESQTNLIQKFGIKQLPTLLVITDPQNYKGELYKGDYKKDQIMKFLREYAYQSKKEKKQSQKQITEYSQQKMQEGFLTTNDNSIGFLLIEKQEQLTKWLPKMQTLVNRFNDDPINFFYIDSQYFDKIFFNQDQKMPVILLTKAKRNRYVQCPQEYLNNLDKVIDFIDDVLGGNGQFLPINGPFKNYFLFKKQDL